MTAFRVRLRRVQRAQRAEASRRLSIVPAPEPTPWLRVLCALGAHRMAPARWTHDYTAWVYRCARCGREEERE